MPLGWGNGGNRLALLAVWLFGVSIPGVVRGHWNVFEFSRVGAAPLRPGGGWFGECFLGLPFASATDLIAAERFVSGRTPDFTFKTDWIDFPAGVVGVDLDESFATVGDFFNDYLRDVSNPDKLKEPFGNLLVRFSGLLKVTYEENNDELGILPVWVSIGCNGYDGFRVRVGSESYRLPLVDPKDSFYFEHFFMHALGLFPIQVTAFNRYAPDEGPRYDRAGIEVYTYHDGGLPWPAGNRLIHARFGPATILPPHVIFQNEDIVPLQVGDFDTDFDIDFRDAMWFQACFSGPADEEIGPVDLGEGCEWMDFDGDLDVDAVDAAAFTAYLLQPR